MTYTDDYVKPTPLLAAALAKAQAEMQNPAFDAENPHFRSKYATLAAVRNAIIPHTSKHGIAVVQEVSTMGDSVEVMTHLYCAEDHLGFGPTTIPVSKHDAQGVKSASTYGCRIALQGVFCVAGDADDDANAAVESRPAPTAKPGDTVKHIGTSPKKKRAPAWKVKMANEAKEAGMHDREELMTFLKSYELIDPELTFEELSKGTFDKKIAPMWEGILKQFKIDKANEKAGNEDDGDDDKIPGIE